MMIIIMNVRKFYGCSQIGSRVDWSLCRLMKRNLAMLPCCTWYENNFPLLSIKNTTVMTISQVKRAREWKGRYCRSMKLSDRCYNFFPRFFQAHFKLKNKFSFIVNLVTISAYFLFSCHWVLLVFLSLFFSPRLSW